MPVTYAELRRRLVKSEGDLRTQLADLDQEVREEGVGYSNHMADVATEVFEQARDTALVRQLATSLANVERALEKFDDGTYGICESCGGSIDLARLEVVPEARYCLDCQMRLERRR
jgi:DnaK suppressor protein